MRRDIAIPFVTANAIAGLDPGNGLWSNGAMDPSDETRSHPRPMAAAVPAGLLVVWHSRTGTARALARALAAGAQAEGAAVTVRSAARATVDDVLAAAAYAFVAPENLASLSGAMKEFFDRTYYPVLDRVAGRGYALVIAAGTDGTGAVRQVERIATGWRLRAVAEPIVALTGADRPETILAPKHVTADQRRAARDLGAALGAGLAMGLW